MNLSLLSVFLRTTKAGAPFRGFMIMAEVGYAFAHYRGLSLLSVMCVLIQSSARCTEIVVMATLCPLLSRRALPVVWIVRDSLSHVLILLPVRFVTLCKEKIEEIFERNHIYRGQPMQSPTTLLRTRTASPLCGLLRVPCLARSSSW